MGKVKKNNTEQEVSNHQKFIQGSELSKISYRDSESGKFTTEKYADKHPKTTEKEKIKIKKKASNS